jgi:hypothetical protein
MIQVRAHEKLLNAVGLMLCLVDDGKAWGLLTSLGFFLRR